MDNPLKREAYLKREAAILYKDYGEEALVEADKLIKELENEAANRSYLNVENIRKEQWGTYEIKKRITELINSTTPNY